MEYKDAGNKKIKNPEGYFARMVQNSKKDEYRANDNQAKHITPVGLIFIAEDKCNTTLDDMEREFSCESPEEWLMLIENERLLAALRSLKPKELNLIYLTFVKDFQQDEIADSMGITQGAVSQRWNRIKRILQNLISEMG